ncbi:MAG: hypothetical protein PVG39_00755 [Desulfobacteraceae bacterium]|jgi:hypothetical protein
MSRIIIVHGIHTHGNDSENSIDAFGQLFVDAGYEVKFFEYPIRWAIPMYWNDAPVNDAKSLIHLAQDGDHIIAHSYGCLIWQETINLGMQWDTCFLFGGAATSEKMYYPEDSLKKAYVIYNPEDLALLVGSLLPGHPFGKLGLVGYRGQPYRKKRDKRFVNEPGFKEDGLTNHSHYWEDKSYWFDFVVKRLPTD